ncbi:MAG: hypothetical protein H6909_01145 [Rickettsiaceae bacterium]|nr:hypothetical protein [Rickettsiaceae bacterium]
MNKLANTAITVSMYSNPMTPFILLMSTTIKVPTMVISCAAKYLVKAKDYILNMAPIAQLAILAAIGYEMFKVGNYTFSKPVVTKSLADAIEVNDKEQINNITVYEKDANKAQEELNEEGQNPLQQAAIKGDFESADRMLSGPHDGLIATTLDVIKHPIRNTTDAVVNNIVKPVIGSISPALANQIPDRTINPGANSKIINHTDNQGNNFVLNAAANFNTKTDLNVIAKAIAKGGDVTIKNKVGDTALVRSLENDQKNVKPTQVVKVFTDNGTKLTKAAEPIVQNPAKAALIKPVVDYALEQNGLICGRDNSQKLLEPSLKPAIEAKNLEVVKELHRGKVNIQDNNTVEVSKLVDNQPTESNIKFETKLLQNVNNQETVQQIKNVVTQEELKTLCAQKEGALNNLYNDPVEAFIEQNLFTTENTSKFTLTELNEFVGNPTVSTGQKVAAVAVSLPNVPNMVNQAVFNTTVGFFGDMLNKASNLVIDVLGAVGQEMQNQEIDTSTINYNVSQAAVPDTTISYTPIVNGIVNPHLLGGFGQQLMLTGCAIESSFDTHDAMVVKQ